MQALLPHEDDRVSEAVAAHRRQYGESGHLGSVPYPCIGKALEEMRQSGLRREGQREQELTQSEDFRPSALAAWIA